MRSSTEFKLRRSSGTARLETISGPMGCAPSAERFAGNIGGWWDSLQKQHVGIQYVDSNGEIAGGVDFDVRVVVVIAACPRWGLLTLCECTFLR